MMFEIVLASRNKEKKRELKTLLAGLKLKILDLNDFACVPKVKETGKSFEENAILKAVKIAKFTKKFTLADDSGLEVEALGGRPGVYSARFAGKDASYEANNRKLLKLLEKVPAAKRKAKFVCVIAIADEERVRAVVRGECSGWISFEPRGRNGFGYDPVFMSRKYNRTFAELNGRDKNSISHRYRALKRTKKIIQGLLRRSFS